jgi:hypothetical protein
MMLDKQTVLSDNQAVTTGTEVSTNAYDMGAAGTMPYNYGSAPHDIGSGTPVEVIVEVLTAFTAGTSLKVNLITSASSNLGTPTILCGSDAVAEASLVAGYQFRLRAIPQGIGQRYLGVQYVTVGTHSTGNVTAAVVLDRDSHHRPI